MTYRIRRIDDPDEYADELLEMQKTCLPESTPVKLAEGDEWWIAFLVDAPVAFAAMRPSVRWPLTGYLGRAGVLPGHRGNGLQRRLVHARIRRAQALGWQWLVSDTIDNPVSSNNLIKCGFCLYEPKIKWGFKGALYFRKYIARRGRQVKSEMPR